MHVCGQIINGVPAHSVRPDPVPWYRDVTTISGREPLPLPAAPALDYQTAPWVQVAHDCGHGASVTVTPAGHLKIVDAVHTTDGNYAAIRLYGYRIGTVVLTARADGQAADSMTVIIYSPPPPAAVPSPS